MEFVLQDIEYCTLRTVDAALENIIIIYVFMLFYVWFKQLAVVSPM